LPPLLSLLPPVNPEWRHSGTGCPMSTWKMAVKPGRERGEGERKEGRECAANFQYC